MYPASRPAPICYKLIRDQGAVFAFRDPPRGLKSTNNRPLYEPRNSLLKRGANILPGHSSPEFISPFIIENTITPVNNPADSLVASAPFSRPSIQHAALNIQNSLRFLCPLWQKTSAMAYPTQRSARKRTCHFDNSPKRLKMTRFLPKRPTFSRKPPQNFPKSLQNRSKTTHFHFRAAVFGPKTRFCDFRFWPNRS